MQRAASQHWSSALGLRPSAELSILTDPLLLPMPSPPTVSSCYLEITSSSIPSPHFFFKLFPQKCAYSAFKYPFSHLPSLKKKKTKKHQLTAMTKERN